MSTVYNLTTADLSQRLGLGPKAVRRRAAQLGLGLDLEGRAGYRYSEVDYQRLVESLRPVVTPAPRKKKRAA